LIRLQAHENNFSGEVPEALFFNTNLEELRLDENNFVGTISGRIGDLTALKDLRLNNNRFIGTIPATTARLSNLGTLHVFLIGLSATVSRVSLFKSTNAPLLPFQNSWF
jgi:protein brassinosteroid insensitive 1